MLVNYLADELSLRSFFALQTKTKWSATPAFCKRTCRWTGVWIVLLFLMVPFSLHSTQGYWPATPLILWSSRFRFPFSDDAVPNQQTFARWQRPPARSIQPLLLWLPLMVKSWWTICDGNLLSWMVFNLDIFDSLLTHQAYLIFIKAFQDIYRSWSLDRVDKPYLSIGWFSRVPVVLTLRVASKSDTSKPYLVQFDLIKRTLSFHCSNNPLNFNWIVGQRAV